ncbi:N-ethylmaleimide reductase [Aquimixticola soesokkakensis]|uniref:N-ethylmaleimide reductase n=1 Tax=Aquimixticola soesokkakensis TaxID=1519096 RepID=A0A1Y5T1S1_9RHOB|nr:alkene reductase [Aquimixticola soesokkakensis]SLN53942.1 N-ethylmaleimide reductase [Aquimixticola soesokkakensis]
MTVAEANQETKTNTLFEPAQLGSWDLTNRVAMAPMSRFRADPKTWVPADYTAEYYGQRNTCGMLITEATQMSPDAVGYPRSPGLYNAEQTEVWKGIVDAIHAGGAKAVVQLWHTGRISHAYNRPTDNPHPMGPSPIKPVTEMITDEHGMVEIPTPREMTKDDIKYVVDMYAETARNAKAAGFDGIEIHAANGYLIDQFCASNINKRTDEYGGSYENRLRFLREIIETVATVYDKGNIGVRFSPYGTFNDVHEEDPLALFTAQVKQSEASGVGYVHVIRPEVTGDNDVAEAFDHADVIGVARDLYSGVIIAAGQYTRETAEQEIASGRADIVAFGRPFVSNPDLISRMKAGTELAQLNRDTLYIPGRAGYIDYPEA